MSAADTTRDDSERTIRCVVVTPERTVVDAAVDFVVLPMYDGELGVLVNRAPLIGRLSFGELRTRRGEEVQRYFIDGGFAQVRDNTVAVLTPKAIPEDDIDPEQVRDTIRLASEPTADTDLWETRRRTLERSRVQLRIASKKIRGGG